jgi:hypothetical protein
MLRSTLSKRDLEKFKLKEMKIKQCKNILREILFNGLLIAALYVICYTNRFPSFHDYHKHMQTLFEGHEKVKKKIKILDI